MERGRPAEPSRAGQAKAAAPPAGRRLALLVATATYSDPGLAALRAPTGDVQALGEVLGDEAIGAFEVRQLIDRPTEHLKREIEGFFDSAQRNDLLLLYVSGHGVLSQSRRFFFATANTSLRLLRATAVEDSFINDVVQHSRARSIVLILDCCHSGAFGKGLAPKSAISVDVEHRFEGRGRVTLSASTALEYAFEEADPATGISELAPAAPGSLFTRYVVEGLRTGEADIDQDGWISIDELYEYVYERIRERSPHQTPGMAGDVRGDILIARSQRAVEMPIELRRLQESPLPRVREAAISDLATRLDSDHPGIAAAAKAALKRLAEDDSRRVSSRAREILQSSPPHRRSAVSTTDGYISYAHADQQIALDLHAALERHGMRVWVDRDDMRAAANWQATVRSAIESSHALVFALSPDWLASPACRAELDHARDSGKRLVPVLIRPVDPSTVPAALAELNWIDATDPTALMEAAGSIAAALESDLDWLGYHTRLLVKAREWEESGRDRSLLLRGRALEEAQRWLASSAERETPATAIQTEFIAASGSRLGPRLGRAVRRVVGRQPPAPEVSPPRASDPVDLRGQTVDETVLEQLRKELAAGPRPVLAEGATFAAGARLDELAMASASFRHVTFEGSASFRATSFGHEATFDGTMFRGPASFDGAEFGRVSFQAARFAAFVSFAGARMRGRPVFDGAVFEAGVLLEDAVFESGIDLDRATLALAPEGLPEGEARLTDVCVLRVDLLADRVALGDEVVLVTRLAPEADGTDSDHLIALPSPGEVSVDVTILLDATGLEPTDGGDAATLTLERRAPASESARFRLTAMRPGTARVTATVYRGSTFEATIERTVEVAAADLPDSGRPRAEIRPRPVALPDLLLEVSSNGDEAATVLDFRLSWAHPALPRGEERMRSESLLGGWSARATALLTRALEDTAEASAADRRRRLAAVGCHLFGMLVPDKLAEILRAPSLTGRTVLLVCDENAWAPWELLHDGRDFLGARMLIGRWPRELDSVRPHEFPLGRASIAHYEGVDDPDRWAAAIGRAGAPTPTVLPGGLLGELDTLDTIQGLHLVRRDVGVTPAQDAPVLVGDGEPEAVASDVRRVELSLRRNRPLVTLGYLMNGHTEATGLERTWALTFLRARCSAFVGPLWSVDDELEEAFLAELYGRLWAGASIGGAFQAARTWARALRPDDVDWLSWVLFADPMARPYRPVAGDGYAVLEPVGRELDEPLSPGAPARFRATLSRVPPAWHEGRVIEVADQLGFRDLRLHVLATGLEVTPPPPLELYRLPDGGFRTWFTITAPADLAGSKHLVQVAFVDGRRPIHSLIFGVDVAEGSE